MADPTSPRCPATKILELLFMRGAVRDDAVTRSDQSVFLAGQLEIVADHCGDELIESHARLPPERRSGLGRVAEEEVDFGGAQVTLIELDIALPIQLATGGGYVEELADGVRFARRHHVIAGGRMLEHHPHGLD